jgi:negative regulator of genetic competence, sporulation and motility
MVRHDLAVAVIQQSPNASGTADSQECDDTGEGIDASWDDDIQNIRMNEIMVQQEESANSNNGALRNREKISDTRIFPYSFVDFKEVEASKHKRRRHCKDVW